MLVDANGRILLREPAGHFGGYAWTFPKGRPDPGETPEQTALREVKEETGYDANIIGILPHAFAGDTSTTAFFLMEPVGTPGPLDKETAAIKWATYPEAKILISQTTSPKGQIRDLAVLDELVIGNWLKSSEE